MASDNRKLWTLLGLTAGAAVGVWLWARGEERSREAAAPRERVPLEGDAEARLARAIANDLELAGYGLEVRGISEGVLELTGELAESEQRERVVAMAHAIDGVHTVVNRIVLHDEEARAEAARTREGTGGLHHTGMGVGMGTRRQSPDTDPDRPSDRQKLVDRELTVDRMEGDTVAQEPGPEEAGAGEAREPEPGAEAGDTAGEDRAS